MNPEDSNTKFKELERQVKELTKQVDDFTNPTTMPEQFLKTLSDKGFVRFKTGLTTYTNPSGLEFKSYVAEFLNTGGLISYTPKSYLLKFTAATSDVCTSPNHQMIDDLGVYVVSTGVFPAPLGNTAQYFIIDATANTFKLAESRGGTAVDITSTGGGDNYVLITG